MKSSLLSKVIGKDKQGESKPRSEDVYGLAQESFVADRPRAWYRKHWSTDELKKTWPHLNSEQVGSLKDAFTLFDANGKGWFGREELKEVMLALAGGSEPAAQELEQVFSELDCNDDGRVDFPEFVAKFMDFGEAAELQEVLDLLSVPEHDNGSLTLQSLISIFQIIGEPLPEGDTVYLERIVNSMRGPDGKVRIADMLPLLQAMEEQPEEEEEATADLPRIVPWASNLETAILNTAGDESYLMELDDYTVAKNLIGTATDPAKEGEGAEVFSLFATGLTDFQALLPSRFRPSKERFVDLLASPTRTGSGSGQKGLQ